MLTGIDHIVIAVHELEAAVQSYRALGFTVVPGGRHPVGTHNALIAFKDESYLELIAFYEPNRDHRWWAALQKGGGLVDFCLVTDDLAADTAAIRRAGVDIGDPQEQSRVRPDGYRLRWVFSLARGPHRGVAPFLIRDETPREERVPREMDHPNGVTGIGTVTVAVELVETVRDWYARALGRPGEDIQRDDLAAAGVQFTVGPHGFEFLAPRGPQSPLVRWLETRGPSPYAATLRSPSAPPGPLDPARTQGARLAIER
jgi:catechol 2,3-dioxygenase-like lactoylglutathione lyase family enzyme